jgi:recombination protein RecT
MPRSDVDAVMRSTQSKGQWGPWKDHYPEMGRKTVIRRLSKFLPLSIEFQTASALDEMAEAGRDQHIETALDGDYSILGDDAPMIEDQSTPESIDMATGEITTTESDAQEFDQYADLLVALSDCKSVSDITRLVQVLSQDQKQSATIQSMVRARQSELKGGAE